MRKTLYNLVLGLISGLSMASNKPHLLSSVRFVNLTPTIQTVFLGEQVSLSFLMYFTKLKQKQVWFLPASTTIQIHTPQTCPPFINGPVNLGSGLCHFSLTLRGEQLGQLINGVGGYYLSGSEKGLTWDILANLHFSVRVIAHPLSMANMPLQKATASLPVYLDLRRYVNFYFENLQAGSWPVAEVFPPELDGLYYDPALFAIVGTPTRTGTYHFNVRVANEFSRAGANDLIFEVGINPYDTPIFKTNYPIPPAKPGQGYQLNLMDRIKEQTRYLENNRLRFRIDTNESHPDWLSIDDNDKSILIGQVPLSEAGGSPVELTIIATSNTGGDSRPLQIEIPIATDDQRSENDTDS
jgi:hypothetical protein